MAAILLEIVSYFLSGCQGAALDHFSNAHMMQQHRRCRGIVTLRVKLKARWISRWDYETFSPAYSVGPHNTVYTHPLSQYLLNFHILMKPIKHWSYKLKPVRGPGLNGFVLMYGLLQLYAWSKTLLHHSSFKLHYQWSILNSVTFYC